MSDTPRTDVLLIAHDMDPKPMTLIFHARELERQLNEANERIMRLEEAGDNLESKKIPTIEDRKAWRKAKEDKL